MLVKQGANGIGTVAGTAKAVPGFMYIEVLYAQKIEGVHRDEGAVIGVSESTGKTLCETGYAREVKGPDVPASARGYGPLLRAPNDQMWVIVPTKGRWPELIETLAIMQLAVDFLNKPVMVCIVDDSEKQESGAKLLKAIDDLKIPVQIAKTGGGKGVNAAMRLGVSRAPQDAIVVRCDDHDWLVPHALRLIWDAMESGEVVYCYGHRYVMNTKHRMYREEKVPEYQPWMFVEQGGQAVGCHAWRKEIWDEVGGIREDEFPAGDYGFALRVEYKTCGERIVAIQEFLSSVTTAPDGISVSMLGEQANMAEALRDKARAGTLFEESRPVPAAVETPISEPEPQCSIPQRLMEFDLSSDCTRNCPFCAPGIPKERRKAKLFLSEAVHRDTLIRLREAGFNRSDRSVVYAGHGEPLMHPRLFPMLQMARRILPNVKIVVYTNGDLLKTRHLNAFGALNVICIYDNYDDKTGRKVWRVNEESTCDRSLVRIEDHVRRRMKYTNRSGTLREPEPGALNARCVAPSEKLFMSSAGKWRLCCDDYAWATEWPGELGPAELNEEKEFKRLREELAKSARKVVGHDICKKCDRIHGQASRFDGPETLSSYVHLRTPRVAPVVKDMRRLVIIPVGQERNPTRSAHRGEKMEFARNVLDAVDRRSTVEGDTLVLWNDDYRQQCPEELQGNGRIIWEYNGALGWSGINRGIGEALRFALESGYDAAIKLDTDVAIMRDGWDAMILDGMDSFEQRGYVQNNWDQSWPKYPLGAVKGPFASQLEKMMWSRRWVAQGLHDTEYIQGGCYAYGAAALQWIEDTIGLVPIEPENRLVGEDVNFSTRSKILGVPLVSCPAVLSKFSADWDYHLSVARYFRDRRGVAVIHPIRNLEKQRALCHE